MLHYLIDGYGNDYFFSKPAKTPAKTVISLELKKTYIYFYCFKTPGFTFSKYIKKNKLFRDLNRDVSEAMNMEGLQDLEERFSNQAIQ